MIIEFNRRGLIDKTLRFTIGESTVRASKDVKFLGIWLDNNLNYGKQIQHVSDKVKKANGILY